MLTEWCTAATPPGESELEADTFSLPLKADLEKKKKAKSRVFSRTASDVVSSGECSLCLLRQRQLRVRAVSTSVLLHA